MTSRRSVLLLEADADLRKFLGGRIAAAIFPEDIEALRGVRADVLVAHEAPSCHRSGFVGIDTAANVTAARLVIHGRHHESGTGRVPSGIPVRGLGRAEAFLLRPEDLP